ncbi:coiled-coil domain-containing protein 63-like [Centruroides sculpturatus]|uniref:coiled-coil domain-containing protein 63-like n=1 Tax=Centruroides sculpturatus TaxID=218467 RepID=UPI000C6DBD57|nr:coiled-coil domain-containing protein 63-like [Centruroides sculpturatus]
MNMLSAKKFSSTSMLNRNKILNILDPVKAEDSELELEAKLDKLQRLDCWNESKRIGFYSKIQVQLDKQQHIINDLLKERNELELNLNKATSKIFLRENEKWSVEFTELLEYQDKLKLLTNDEVQKIEKIEEEIKQIDKQIHHYQIQLYNANKNISQTSNHKKLWILENKLYQMTVKHNIMVNNNKNLRDYITLLLKLRFNLNHVFAHYSRILIKRKTKIQNLCKDAKTIYDQREEIRNHLQTLEETSQLEFYQNSQKIKEFTKLLKFQKDLSTFMTQKQKPRTEVKESMDKRDKGEENTKELLHYYNKAFERIKEAAHDNDINNIAKDFVQTEEENFKLFKFINELRDQNEHILEKIESIKENLEALRREDERQQQQHDVTINKLENRLKLLSDTTSSTEEKLKLCKRSLDMLKQGLINLFRESGCNDQALTTLLGGSDGVTNDNILKYLSILENWISELILYHQYLKVKDPDSIMGKMADKKPPKIRPSVSSLSFSGIPASTIPVLNPAIDDIEDSFHQEFDVPALPQEDKPDIQQSMSCVRTILSRQELEEVSRQRIEKMFSEDVGSVQIFNIVKH